MPLPSSLPRPTRTMRFTLLLVLGVLLLSGCIPFDYLIEIVTPTAPPRPAQNGAGSDFSVYFTDPTLPSSEQLQGGPDVALAEAIDGAHASVDVAIYQLNLDRIAQALIEAQERGVTVRVVTESDYGDEDQIEDLKDAGIEVLGDRRDGLMHNKFTVIDQSEVWTGSMNYTINDAYRNNNNLIRIHSQQVAENYTTEFNEMFEEDLFGATDRPATPFPLVNVSGTQVEVFFSPDDGVTAHLVDVVGRAQESIRFLAFSYTSNELAEVMLERADAGVSVQGIFEESQYKSNTGGEFDALLDAGLDVRLDGNPKNMHNKVIILDDSIVVTGSFNFSASAEKRNDENLLILYSPALAAQYLAEFQKLWDQAQQPE